MKVVLDTSTWISAFEFGGNPAAAAAQATRDELVVCSYIESEIYRILTGKFEWTRAEVQTALEKAWRSATWITTTGSLSGVCRDPADDAILECAVLADAVLIVSGDHDLLDMGQYQAVRILTARQYLEQAEAAGA